MEKKVFSRFVMFLGTILLKLPELFFFERDNGDSFLPDTSHGVFANGGGL